MTKEDAAGLLDMNFILYKLGSNPLPEDELETLIDVWAYQFKDYDAGIVKKAFLEANRVCKYPISVADVYEHLPKENFSKTWSQLKAAIGKAKYYMGWRSCPMVIGIDKDGRAIKSNGATEIENLYDGLPETVKKWLGSKSELINLTRYTEDELERYKRPEFVKQKTVYVKNEQRKSLDGKNAERTALKANQQI